ncbi:hypothetical protein HU200_045483 [Digitaria exilis]|uniref:Demeter RRM-fold domain-containing protein n=1 Tax=Digitaria exilis TaxID=1010633 RepID=A0A835B6I4_9POAL|nr:hypothetical protein HU200_045483 [Digitaria exilis]
MFVTIEEAGFHDFDIEDVASERNVMEHVLDGVIDLRSSKSTENAATWPAHGKEMIPIQPRVSSRPMIKRYRLRTEYTAYGKISYIISLCLKAWHIYILIWVPDDCNPYLLIIQSSDEHIVNATILIPCRTANENVFPLNGTYFQDNEVNIHVVLVWLYKL